jgi:hypothetical protein
VFYEFFFPGIFPGTAFRRKQVAAGKITGEKEKGERLINGDRDHG